MADFHTVAKATDIPLDDMKLVELNGDEIVLANVGGTICAFGNICPHEEGPLIDGELQDETITCPWHFTVFNIKTGEAIEGVTDDPIPVYEVHVEGEDVQLRKV